MFARILRFERSVESSNLIGAGVNVEAGVDENGHMTGEIIIGGRVAVLGRQAIFERPLDVATNEQFVPVNRGRKFVVLDAVVFRLEHYFRRATARRRRARLSIARRRRRGDRRSDYSEDIARCRRQVRSRNCGRCIRRRVVDIVLAAVCRGGRGRRGTGAGDGLSGEQRRQLPLGDLLQRRPEMDYRRR